MNQAEVLGHGLKLQHLMVAIAVAEWDSMRRPPSTSLSRSGSYQR